MIYFKLFYTFILIGAFSFGGGYGSLMLIQNQVVDINHWLTVKEFNDLITLSQMTPGPIGINGATFVGLKMAGLSGAIIATIGYIIPSLIIVGLLAYLYTKYKHLKVIQDILSILRPCVVALIAVAGVSILTSSFFPNNTINITMIVIFIICLVLLKKEMNPILVMTIAGILNILSYLIIQ